MRNEVKAAFDRQGWTMRRPNRCQKSSSDNGRLEMPATPVIRAFFGLTS